MRTLTWFVGIGACALCCFAEASAEETVSVAADEPVEFFAAIENDQIEAHFLPRNERQATLRLRNKTQRPLDVRMPRHLAAVPILAQFQLPPLNGPPARQSSQAVAGNNPFGNLFPNNQQNNPQGNNFFQIPPERIVERPIETVCLQYGLATPRPGMRYRLARLETLLEDVEPLRVALERWAEGAVDQRVVQAVAWHRSSIGSRLSFDELQQLAGPRTTVGRSPVFTKSTLQRAREVVRIARETPSTDKAWSTKLTRRDER